MHKTGARELCIKLMSISIGFILSFTLLELATRLIPASDGVSLETPLECDDVENPTLRCIFRRPANRQYLYTKGKLPPLPIKAVKKSNDIGQFSDISWAAFTNSKPAERIRVLSIGDSFVEADQVENHQTFHGLLNHATTKNGKQVISTAIGSNGNSFPQYLVHLAFAKKQLGAATTYIVIPIIPNDFSDAFFKGSGLKAGSYFTKQKANKFSILFQPYKSNPAVSARRFAINTSSFLRYLIYNLELSSLAFRYPICYLSNAGCVSKKNSSSTSSASRNEGQGETHKDATDYFFNGLSHLTKTRGEKRKTIFILDCQRPQIYTEEGHEPTCTDERYLYFRRIALSKGYRVVDMKPVFSKDYASNRGRFEFSNDLHWNKTAHKLVSNEVIKLISIDDDIPSIATGVKSGQKTDKKPSLRRLNTR